MENKLIPLYDDSKTYYCEECEQFKELMDMHTRTNGKCKLCWSKKEDKNNLKRGGNRKGYKDGKKR